jgi:L,D-transpeptidase ErfK/SrfK
MKQRWIFEMARLVFLTLFMLLLLVPVATPEAATPETPSAPPLYRQVVGGEEVCEVPPKTSLGILAAEKGLKWTVVARHNGLKKPYKIKKGMVLNLNTRHIVPAEVDNGMVINLPELLMYHFVNGVCQRRYSLAVGKPSWPTPTGNYKIIEKRKNPTWNVPPSIQEEMEEQGLEVVEKVPPGPKNPLGKYFMGTSASGVGIHATNRPWSVGSYVSHGCMRMLPDEIAALFPQVAVGTPVKIIYRPLKLAATPEGRIYLEAHPNIYHWELNAKEWVRDMADYYQIGDRIDWEKVPAILKAKEGIAQDVTKGAPRPLPAGSPGAPAAPQEVRLSPLQVPQTPIE